MDRAAVAARNADITLTADGPSGLMVAGDRGLLTTAVTNLVENAVYYSPTRSAVSLSRKVRAGQVEIAVTDRGIGIAPEHQRRVFERFFRVDPARSRGTGGAGLGLAIVKDVAAIHGGTVALWSRVGVGSTFTLSLPLASLQRQGAGALEDGAAGTEGDAAPAGGVAAAGSEAPDSPSGTGLGRAGLAQPGSEQTGLEQTALEQTALEQTGVSWQGS
jgi:two-component system sensor histidine kinase SenX3